MLLSPNSSWFKQIVLLLISSRFYGGTKGQTYQGEFTSPTSLSSQELYVLWKEQSKAKTELINKNSCLAVLSSFVRFSGYMAFFSCLFCIVFLFCSYFSNVLCNPLQPPLSTAPSFSVVASFCLFFPGVFVWFGLSCVVFWINYMKEVLCGPLDSQFYHLNGNVEVGTPHFWTDPNAAWRNQRQGFLSSMNLASVLVLGVTCHKISQIAIANSMWLFSSNPITSTPPRMGSPAVSS